FGRFRAVTKELGRPEPIAEAEPDLLGLGLARASPARPRLFLLTLHRAGEAGIVDLDAANLERVGGEVEREAVGIVETERDVAGEGAATREPLRRFLEQRQSARQRP